MYEVWSDGSCKPKKENKKNKSRGFSSIGVVIKRNGKEFYRYASYIGSNYDNNQAEYIAFIHSIKKIIEFKAENVQFYTDSDVIEKQIIGVRQARSETILSYYVESFKLLQSIKNWKIKWVPRRYNSEADKLASSIKDKTEVGRELLLF